MILQILSIVKVMLNVHKQHYQKIATKRKKYPYMVNK